MHNLSRKGGPRKSEKWGEGDEKQQTRAFKPETLESGRTLDRERKWAQHHGKLPPERARLHGTDSI